MTIEELKGVVKMIATSRGFENAFVDVKVTKTDDEKVVEIAIAMTKITAIIEEGNDKIEFVMNIEIYTDNKESLYDIKKYFNYLHVIDRVRMIDFKQLED